MKGCKFIKSYLTIGKTEVKIPGFLFYRRHWEFTGQNFKSLAETPQLQTF